MKTLFFVRHGQTFWNAEKRMQGQANSDLNELGQTQAAVNATLLAQFPVQKLYVSPLQRTRQTAAIINAESELPVEFDARLMEWDCGDWSGYLYDEIAQRWPEQWSAYQADRHQVRAPNGENVPDMIARSAPVLDALRAAQESCVAIVSHGMIGRVMLQQLLCLSVTQALALRQPNDRVYRVQLADGRAVVDYFDAGQGPFPGLPDGVEDIALA